MDTQQTSISMEDIRGKKVALVHDFLVCRGGAEKVLEVLAEMFPDAPIYTLLYDSQAMGDCLKKRDIRTSFLQKFPRFLKKRYRFLLPFFPVAVEAFDLRDFDMVISSSSAWSKGIVTRLHTKHIAYIHSPMRYVWDYNEQYLKEIGEGRLGIIKRLLLSYLRVWDKEAADRSDILIANSLYTKSRIAKYYRRESALVYPPLQYVTDTSKASNAHIHQEVFFECAPKEYFIVVSRLTPNKKVELVVDAFNKLGLPLIIVGEGSQKQHLLSKAKPNIHIVGWQNEAMLDALYYNARALIFPAEDDFGLVMTEAMYAGIPVIAYAEGGALEIVQEGVTGEFFRAQTPEILADGVRRFLENEQKYDATVIQKNVGRFSREIFEESLYAQIKDASSGNVKEGVVV